MQSTCRRLIQAGLPTVLFISCVVIACGRRIATAQNPLFDDDAILELDSSRKAFVLRANYAEALAANKQLSQVLERKYGPDNWKAKECQALELELTEILSLNETKKALFDKALSALTKELAAMSYRSSTSLAQLQGEIGDVIGKQSLYVEAGDRLVLAYILRGDFPRAETLARGQVTAWQELFGEDNDKIPEATNRLSLILVNEGKLKEAEPLIKRGLEQSVTFFGTESLPYYESLNYLAFLKLRQGDAIEAFVLSREAMLGYMRLMKTQECEVGSALFTWGMANAKMKHRQAARDALQKYLALHKGRTAPDHPLSVEAAEELNRLAEQEP